MNKYRGKPIVDFFDDVAGNIHVFLLDVDVKFLGIKKLFRLKKILIYKRYREYTFFFGIRGQGRSLVPVLFDVSDEFQFCRENENLSDESIHNELPVFSQREIFEMFIVAVHHFQQVVHIGGDYFFVFLCNRLQKSVLKQLIAQFSVAKKYNHAIR